MKKLLSVLLTAALCMSSSLFVYAAEPVGESKGNETKVTQEEESQENGSQKTENESTDTAVDSEADIPETESENVIPETESESMVPETESETVILETESETAVSETESESIISETENSEKESEISAEEAYSSEKMPNITPVSSPSDIKAEVNTIYNAVTASLPAAYSSLTNDQVMNIQIEMLIYINVLRQAQGLEPLTLIDSLASAAMERAAECQILNSHTRPNGEDCFSILDEYGIPSGTAGENIAMGQTDVYSVMLDWWNSSSHRSNILGSGYQAVGVGIDNSSGIPTWVQLFTGGYTPTAVGVYNLKDTYNVGEKLQDQGISLIVEYSNGLSGFMPLLDTMVSGYDPNKEGTQTITIKCQGFSGSKQIKVVDPVKAFVSRLYTQILGRNADTAGLNNWTNVLRSGKEQGAKVAQGFVESTELKSRNLSDKEYITIMYRTFLNREPDSAGLKAWQAVLDSGLSRLHVFKGFAESDEFTKICKEYGIVRGTVNLTAPMDQNEGVTKFIARCYKLCLGRKADDKGLNEWCNQLLTGKNTAKQAAHGFVFSDEFKRKNLSDKEYIKVLYRVFMDREADNSGLNAWIKVLQSGKSREHVFNGFADSNEFKEICRSYGIK